jgi:arginine N-succinyltransferase
MIIRPVAMSDLADLKTIAAESGPGFTSLVDDHDFLVQKIQRSLESFAAPAGPENPGTYLFVLTEPETGQVMGTTGIAASVGTKRPLYHYRLAPAVQPSARPGSQPQTLTLCSHYTGCSEICSLYLRPRYRRAWAGKLLSRVRFLFMARHPERFADKVIAEMRGVSDQAGESPFWRWLQAHYVDLDFATVSQMVGTGDNGFIADLVPTHPIYTRLMDPQAREVIARVHPDTRPALHMLESEGFRFRGLIDPFDGGPTVEAPVRALKSVRQSVPCRARIAPETAPGTADGKRATWTNGGQGKTLMVANTGTADFRATVTTAARYLPAHGLLEIPGSLAQTLGLTLDGKGGADVWFTDLEAASRQPEAVIAANGQSNPAEESYRAH